MLEARLPRLASAVIRSRCALILLNRSGSLTPGVSGVLRLTSSAVAWLVERYAGQVGLRGISPHDLRRTAAALARRGGASIEQVQVMLGHSSPQTTSQYIGEGLDLDDHAVDYSDVRVNK